MTAPAQRIFTGRVITLDVADVELPNGRVASLEIVTHPGGAAVVAVNAANEVCLLRQYRHVTGGWIWEIPAGKLDGKSPDEIARNELREEAGRRAASWASLGRMWSSPGVFTEIVHLYLARDLEAVPADLEPEEVIEVHWVPLGEAVGRALSGEIEDAKTVVGLLRTAVRLGLIDIGRVP
jgi:ADP-ribose pyrophosphatase